MVAIMATLVCGCAVMTGKGGIFYSQAQQIRLSRAIALQEEGKSADAEKLLVDICAGEGVPGVTDEALFRLGLLRLDPALPSSGIPGALHNLGRLGKEYPSSTWAPLAAQLARHLTAAEDVQQQDAKLKETNLSLTRENRELRQRLEKLKNLELELGKGAGR
jgi:hypothetical protein